jgi:transcriptional regulator with XRE-family HTH domain
MNRGLYLKNLRLNAGLTQAQTAEIVGVKHSTISAYERETVNIPSERKSKNSLKISNRTENTIPIH